MLQNLLRRAAKSFIFPDSPGNWYQEKGYQDFEHYMQVQKSDSTQPMYGIFQDVNIQACRVTSYSTKGDAMSLDGVTITMKHNVEGLPYDQASLPCKNKHIVFCLCLIMPYQSRLRESAILACKTGATVHSFSYPGTYQSSGSVKEFDDITNSIFAVVYHIIMQEHIHPNDVVLHGNCLGGSIAESVARKIKEELGIQIRQINDNSGKSTKIMFLSHTKWLGMFTGKTVYALNNVGLLKKLLIICAMYAKTGKNLRQTGPYVCYFYRINDKYLIENDRMHTKFEKYRLQEGRDKTRLDLLSGMVEASDWTNDDYAKHYKLAWLPKSDSGNVIIRNPFHGNDPHDLHIYQLRSECGNHTQFDVMNAYFKASGRWISENGMSEREIQENLIKARPLREACMTPTPINSPPAPNHTWSVLAEQTMGEQTKGVGQSSL